VSDERPDIWFDVTWEPLLEYPMACHCTCGGVWASAVKLFYDGKNARKRVTHRPCPDCGSYTDAWKFSSLAWENWTVSSGDIGNI
jgi:hypothetical protein